MDLSNRITQLEDEIKVLKNEVLAVLLDVRENLLTRENPFAPQPPPQAPAATIAVTAESAPPPPAPEPPPVEKALEPPPPAPEPVAVSDSLEDAIDEGEEMIEEAAPENYEAAPAPRAVPAATGVKPAEAPAPEPVKGWRAVGETGGVGQKDGAIALDTLSGLIKWVETTSAQLGPERAQTILDISEMMGHMPEQLKATLEKFIQAAGPAAVVEEKVATRTYLTALKELAKLLGKDTAADYLVLQIVSNGLTSMNRKQNG